MKIRISVANRRTMPNGWQKDPRNVSVGRDSPWGNPFIVGVHGERGECVTNFRKGFEDSQPFYIGLVTTLKHHIQARCEATGVTEISLVCWCAPLACHAMVYQQELIRRWPDLFE